MNLFILIHEFVYSNSWYSNVFGAQLRIMKSNALYILLQPILSAIVDVILFFMNIIFFSFNILFCMYLEKEHNTKIDMARFIRFLKIHFFRLYSWNKNLRIFSNNKAFTLNVVLTLKRRRLKRILDVV